MSQPTHHLLSLFVSILVPILSEWINDEDLCYLDTAVCSKKTRNNFLRVLEQCSIENTDMNRISDGFKVIKDWMLLRRVGLKKYSIDWKVPADELKLLFKSKRLIHVISKSCGELYRFLNVIAITADRIVVTDPICTVDELKTLENQLTDIKVVFYSTIASIAKVCSNLRSIHLQSIAPVHFIDHCPLLDTIVGCEIKAILDRTDYCKRYSCDLKRTSVVDGSAVCLGEGKYFNLTALNAFSNLNEEDRVLLSPLLKHLTKLTIGSKSLNFPEISVTCCHLTSIVIDDHGNYPDLSKLLSHSPMLREFRLLGFCRVVDSFLHWLSLNCPLLEEFESHGMIQDIASLSLLFESCLGLKQCSCVDYLVFESKRHSASLNICSSGCHPAVQAILKHSPQIQTLCIGDYNSSHEEFYATMFQSIPQLTSLTINANKKKISNGYGKHLDHLTHLKFLRLNSFGDTLESGLFQNKRKLRVLHLVFSSCTSELLAEISNNCPELIRLKLFSKNSFKVEDIARLRSKCTKLEEYWGPAATEEN